MERTSIKHKFWVIYHCWIMPRETPPGLDSLGVDSAMGDCSAGGKFLSPLSEECGVFSPPSAHRMNLSEDGSQLGTAPSGSRILEPEESGSSAKQPFL